MSVNHRNESRPAAVTTAPAWRRWLPFLLLLPAALGCSTTVASQAVNGKAYVVRGSIFGTQAYNCMTQGDAPVCYPVEEVRAR